MRAGPACLRRIGDPPITSSTRQDWLTFVATVVAYRDRYGITSDLPVGPGARTEAERTDRRGALAARRRAAVLARVPSSTLQSSAIPQHPKVVSHLGT